MIGLAPAAESIVLARRQIQSASDLLRDAVQRQRRRVFLRLILGCTFAAHAKRFARQIGKAVPDLSEVERARQPDARFDAGLECCRARSVIAAETDTPQGDFLRIYV